MFFVMSLRLSDHKVLHNIASVLIKFFRFRSDLLPLFARISYFQIFGVKEFNKTIIPFALVGYETGYSQLGATRLVGYLPSHPTRAHGMIVNYQNLVSVLSASAFGFGR